MLRASLRRIIPLVAICTPRPAWSGPRLAIGCTCLWLCGLAISTRADDWPQWQGVRRDGVSQEKGLLREWPAEGPPLIWRVENVGVGFSSLAVVGGRIYTLGDLDGVEHVLAYDEADGKRLWAVQPDPVAQRLAARVTAEFQEFDKNADGVLDEVEAAEALGEKYIQSDLAVEGDKVEIAKQRARQFIELVDENKDGRLSYAEFPERLRGTFEKIDAEDPTANAQQLAERRAAELMAALDKDGNGQLSKAEVDNSQAQSWLDKADRKADGSDKGDGALSLDELSAYLADKQARRDGLVTADELETYYIKSSPGKDGVLTPADLRRAFGGYRNSFGDGPRSTPTVEGERLYVEGARGDVACLDTATGKTIWCINMVDDLGGHIPGWGYSESPLVTEQWVIVTPGGKEGTLAALEKTTGKVVWRSAAVTEGAHYSSPQLATLAGVPQYVQFAANSLFGVSVDGSRLLWTYKGANNGVANITTPVIYGDHVLASSAYGKGSGLVQITSQDGEQKATEVYFQPKLPNHHGGIVKVGDHVYGTGGPLTCLNFLTGEIAWQNRGTGKGSLIAVDGMLYCLGEKYELALVEADPSEYREHGRIKLEDFGRPSWAHPVVANGTLFVRNMHELRAYNVRSQP